MLKKIVLAAMVAGSTLIALPQAASANGCGLNCVYVTVIDGHGNVVGGYWDCPVEMECITPAG